jgi:hypothetical protein
MDACGQHINSGLIGRLQALVDTAPQLSRRELSRHMCRWLDWRAPNGRLREMGARKLLLALERRGVLSLPACGDGYAFEQPVAAPRWVPPVPQIACALAGLGKVEVTPVGSRYSVASRVWKGLMQAFHPLGGGPLCGAQIRYVVHSSRYGWLGGLSFSAPTWRLRPRDEWIGWSEAARRQHLQEVVNNSRFLIVPSVRVPHLASQVLSRCLQRLPLDWAARYGYAPVLVETFVDGARFAGTSYRAANWRHLGQTAARADPYPNGKASSGPKQLYVYPL